MARRDPHDVLGVPRDASAATIKAAWRRLAREHHPDLAAGDPAAARRSTRRMVEINTAYESLRAELEGGDGANRAGSATADRPGRSGGRPGAGRPRPPMGPNVRMKAHAPGGPPRPSYDRPVTGRVDTSATFRAAGEAPRGHPGPTPRPVAPPDWRIGREPLRASDPNGPLQRSRHRDYVPPPLPPLPEALATRIEFGKFHGHTLGEIAAFEPSYIDWVASTITRDRDLVAAARVIRDELDARGIRRVRRAERVAPWPEAEE